MSVRSGLSRLLARALQWDSVAGWSIVQGQQPTVYQGDGRTIRRVGWERHPVVNACVRAIADLVAAVPFEVYKPTSDGTTDVLEDHPLRDLLHAPRVTEADFRHRRRTAIHLLLFGNAFWYLERPSPRGLPTALRIVKPDDLQHAWLNEDDVIAAYSWRDLAGRSHDRTPVQDMVHFRDADADDGLFGYPRLAAALNDIAADKEATDYVREIVSNHGQPGAIAKVKGYTSRTDLLEAEASFNQRMQARGNRGKTFFMNAEDMELTPLGFNLNELEFPDLRRIAREDICAAAGVDPRIVGVGSAAKDGGLSGEQYREARFRLIQQSVLPVMKLMESEINLWLAPEFGEALVRFDPDVLSELTEDESETSRRALEELKGAAITVEEYRELTGRTAAYDPAHTLAASITIQLTPVKLATVQAEAAADLALNPPPAPAALPSGTDAPDEKPVRTRVLRRGDVLTSEDRQTLWRQFDQRAEAEEAAYKRAALRRFKQEGREVVALVVAADSERADTERPVSQRADPVWDAVLRILMQRFQPAGEYAEAWVTDYARLLAQTFKAGADHLAPILGVAFDVENPRVRAAIRRRASELAEFVTTETANQITAVIEQGRAGGLGIRDIAAQLRESVYGDEVTEARATRIARTETIGAMNEGEFRTAQLSGVMRSKEWLTQGDRRVRDSHELLDGVRIAMDKAFGNGCQHPGDRSGGAKEVINCRCTLLYYDEEAPA